MSENESEYFPLFVSDAELIRRLGVGEKTARVAIRELERSRGFPSKDPLFGDKRYWPAVRRFFDARYGLAERVLSHIPDGNEVRSNDDGTVTVRTPDGREWIEKR